MPIIRRERKPLEDHCGIVAAFSSHDISFFPKGLAGLTVLQTRGYDGAGFCALSASGDLFQHRGVGMVREVFANGSANRLHDVRARIWVYQVRYGTSGAFNPDNVQPIVMTHKGSGERFIVAHNGQFSQTSGIIGATQSDTWQFCERLSESPQPTWEERIVQLLRMMRGAWSLVIATRDALFVSRDPWGFRPFVYGHAWDDVVNDYVWVAASETSSLDVMGATDHFELTPGTIAKISDKGLSILARDSGKKRALCIFENIYLQHGAGKAHLPRTNPRAIKRSPTVDDVRRRCGRVLAREAPLTKQEVDMVIGVPGTGIEGGMQYARALDLPYFQAITDRAESLVEQRTFMTADVDGIYQKVLDHFTFDAQALAGRRVVLVDDSIVRGNITRGLVYLLKNHYQVRAVHLRILSPAIDKACHLGVNTRTGDELIAARHNDDMARIQKELGADSLAYLSGSGLREALTGDPHARGFCMGCMVGFRPPIDAYGNAIAQSNNSLSNHRSIIFTDGEGPIVTNDFAFDIACSLNLRDIFIKLSGYDDYLALENRKNYEAGGTLALIVPFFLRHGLTHEKICNIAQNVRLAPGVRAYLSKLRKDGWVIRIISTAYTQLWDVVGESLSIPKEHITSTPLEIDKLTRQFARPSLFKLIDRVESELLSLIGKDMWSRFDAFFWKELPALGYHPLEIVSVVGGRTKIAAARSYAKDLGVSLSDLIYVGDSITDSELFDEINTQGGLSIAVNGNGFALSSAHAAVAAPDMRGIRPLLNAWKQGGYEKVKLFIQSRVRENHVHYALVDSKNSEVFQRLIDTHAKMRTKLRSQAAVLG